MMRDNCPFCRNFPYFTDLRKIYLDESVCKICLEKYTEQYAGPCGHLICKNCIDKIKNNYNNIFDTNQILSMISVYQIPRTLYTCSICNETFNKYNFSRRQRRKLTDFHCKNCINYN